MIRDLYRYVWNVSGRAQILLAVLSVVVFLIELVPLEIQRRVVNAAVERKDFTSIIWLCGGFVATVLIHGLLKYIVNVYRGRVTESATQRLRLNPKLVAMASTASGEAATDKGVAVSIVVAEVDAVGGFIGSAVAEPLLNAGILVSIFGYMLVIEPWLAGVAILLFIPQVFVIPVLQNAINKRTKKRIETLRAIGGRIVDEPDEIGADAPHHSAKSYRGQVARIFRLNMEIYRRKFGMNFFMNFLHHLGTVGILFVGAWMFIDGKTEMGTVVAFIAGLNRMIDPWGDLVNFFRDVTNTAVKYQMITKAVGTAPDDPAAQASPTDEPATKTKPVKRKRAK